MVWKPAIDLTELQQKERETAVINGEKILFIWSKDQVYAVQAQCPHFKLPLNKGKITDKCAIICPFHKSEFDLTTGEVNSWSPWPAAVGKLLGKLVKPKRLKIYPTRVEEGTIFVELSGVN
ncbi:MAG: Rieske (2Fe-2S) protein [Tatlockia sp.]|nr:Rieske (2Fe-2S) protein [Tatlockia sp.]